jgi:hypothetical protein
MASFGLLFMHVGALRSVAQLWGLVVRATMWPAANQRRATMRTVPIVAGVHIDECYGVDV